MDREAAENYDFKGNEIATSMDDLTARRYP